MKPRLKNQDLNNIAVVDSNLVPLGYAQLTGVGTSTAVSLGTIPDGAFIALIIAEANVEWRDDGTDPTSTVGMPLLANTHFPYNGDLTKLKFVAQSGTAVINVSYYG
jgi:hypothetical protein